MNIVDELTPTTYEPVRIALYQNESGDIVAEGDFIIRNAAGRELHRDNPVTTLTESEQSAFLTWFLAKLTEYEAANPGLARWAP